MKLKFEKTKRKSLLGIFTVPTLLLITLGIGIALICGAPISPLWLLAPILSPVVLAAAIAALAVAIGVMAVVAVVAFALLAVVIGLVFLVPILLLVLLYKIGEVFFGF